MNVKYRTTSKNNGDEVKLERLVRGMLKEIKNSPNTPKHDIKTEAKNIKLNHISFSFRFISSNHKIGASLKIYL